VHFGDRAKKAAIVPTHQERNWRSALNQKGRQSNGRGEAVEEFPEKCGK
jgi:hypothetical protein